MIICLLGAGLFRKDGGRTDIHDEASSHFSQFCERAYKKWMLLLTQRSCIRCVKQHRSLCNNRQFVKPCDKTENTAHVKTPSHHRHCKQRDVQYLLTSFPTVASPGDTSGTITTLWESTICHSRGTVLSEPFCATPDTVYTTLSVAGPSMLHYAY